MVAGGERFCAKRLEGVVDHRRGRFGPEAASPEFRLQMETQLGDSFFEPVGAQSAATDKSVAIQQIQRPVLEVMRDAAIQLHSKPACDLFIGKGPAKKFGDFQMAPQSTSKRQIVLPPPAKSEPLGPQKIRLACHD